MHEILVEEERSIAGPLSTVQNEDDTFECPYSNCSGRVPITYWKDKLGQDWPSVGLCCPDCNRKYSIVR